MAETAARLPYGILWLLFIACLLLGAGMFVAGHAIAGAILIGIPLLGSFVVTGVYYLLERRHGDEKA